MNDETFSAPRSFGSAVRRLGLLLHLEERREGLDALLDPEERLDGFLRREYRMCCLL